MNSPRFLSALAATAAISCGDYEFRPIDTIDNSADAGSIVDLGGVDSGSQVDGGAQAQLDAGNAVDASTPACSSPEGLDVMADIEAIMGTVEERCSSLIINGVEDPFGSNDCSRHPEDCLSYNFSHTSHTLGSCTCTRTESQHGVDGCNYLEEGGCYAFVNHAPRGNVDTLFFRASQEYGNPIAVSFTDTECVTAPVDIRGGTWSKNAFEQSTNTHLPRSVCTELSAKLHAMVARMFVLAGK